MKIVIIGAGNLAVHLSESLKNAGFEIAQIYNRSEKSARGLADALHTRYTTDVTQIDSDASLYMMCVSDDAIASIAEKMPPADGLVVHTAGSVPMKVLSDKFRNCGVLYPLQTFSKSRPVDFTEIPLFLETNTPENLQLLRRIAEKISEKVYDATSDERIRLHLAAVFGCNFVNCLYNISAKIVGEAGYDFEILAPLIVETARKALASGNPGKVQTGPAVRNDMRVIQKHSELLSGRPDLQEIYVQLSKYISTSRFPDA
jgi:predicted short-subunit dehydrogenase-like oxidoreductase (DUF2520 family)